LSRSYAASQLVKTDTLSWNANVHYRFHKSLPLVATPNQMSPAQSHFPYFRNINFDYTFRLRPGPHVASSLQIIQSNLRKHLPPLLHIPHVLPIPHNFLTRKVSPHLSSKTLQQQETACPHSAGHTKTASQGIKPVAAADIDVPVPCGWLLSVDARSKAKFWLCPLNQKRSTHNDILPLVEEIRQ
jgi:hypothetical protein